MANSIAAGAFQQFWSRTMQRIHHVKDVYRAIANFGEKEGILKLGQQFNRPYKTKLTSNPVGTGGSYTRQDVTVTNEYLTVDQKEECSFYIEDYNELQSSYPLGASFAKDAAIVLGNQIDGKVFGEYDQADETIDNGDLGGSSGDGLTLTTSNVLKMFTIADRKQSALNIDEQDRWAVLSYQFREKLMEYLGGKESNLGDTVGKNGSLGAFMGRKIYLSNALGWSGRLEFGTNPTENDTVVINGVTFTFKATPSSAGDVDIGANAAASLDNLVAAINNSQGYAAGQGSATTYYEVSASDRKLLKNITATDGTTYLTLKATGKSYVPVSETLTATADVWTAAKQIQHVLFGQGKPIDVVIQKYPKLEIHHRDGYIGRDFVTWELFGIKTFDEGKAQLVDCQIRSDGF